MEREMEEMRRNHETTLNSAVGQVENEARVEIDRIQREVHHEMKAFEDDTMKAAQLEIQNKCAAMKESLEAQYQAQRDDLTTECELIYKKRTKNIRDIYNMLSSSINLNYNDNSKPFNGNMTWR